MDINEQRRKLQTDVAVVFLALKDRETPLLAKILAGITIGYALSPIDFIPDFIPVLGYLDDIILLPALAALTVRLIPEDIRKKHQETAKEIFSQKKIRKKWYYAIPVVFAWILIAWFIAKLVFL